MANKEQCEKGGSHDNIKEFVEMLGDQNKTEHNEIINELKNTTEKRYQTSIGSR